MSPLETAQQAHAQGLGVIEIIRLLRSLFDLSLIEAKDLAHQGVYSLTLNDYQEHYLVPMLLEALKEDDAWEED
ncbi:hypothetical protein C8263_15890 [Deinococcus arcticus]|uniref:Uncharacterized protein n=2 Tax=Deinococcus arcticus TaxID=2136176 RepID=A0A2T3W4K0_9DEIO|nr:hypothetical protein C8263_15890 [Deinococcus arcticus]